MSHVTAMAAVQLELHCLTLALLLQLLMTALISGEQQSNTLTVARLVSECCRARMCTSSTHLFPPLPPPQCHKNTLHSPNKFSTNCFYPPHPVSVHAPAHTNLGLGRVARVRFSALRLYLIMAGG